jgi:hypothetical protein
MHDKSKDVTSTADREITATRVFNYTIINYELSIANQARFKEGLLISCRKPQRFAKSGRTEFMVSAGVDRGDKL